MIHVTRLNGTSIHVNAELLLSVESHHDTVLTLTDGKTCVVNDSAEQVVDAVIDYRARVLARAQELMSAQPVDEGFDADVVQLRPTHTGRG